MKEYIERRVLETADYIIETGATVRTAANVFGISKSTVHKDMTQRLSELSPDKAERVKKVLCDNLAERRIRGGNATREKYKKMHSY